MSTEMEGTPFHSADATGVPDGAEPHAAVTITMKPAGPLVISGEVTILDNEGRVMQPPATKLPSPLKLCGCGLSLTRPFCDGSHKR